jgi:hypothetical protein
MCPIKVLEFGAIKVNRNLIDVYIILSILEGKYSRSRPFDKMSMQSESKGETGHVYQHPARLSHCVSQFG